MFLWIPPSLFSYPEVKAKELNFHSFTFVAFNISGYIIMEPGECKETHCIQRQTIRMNPFETGRDSSIHTITTTI